jgi:CHAD domain-containing protein
MYQIREEESSDTAVKRVIWEEIEGSIALLADPAVSQEESASLETAVHEARKSIKRVRAALRLVRVDIGEAVFGRENTCFRDIARQLAPVRDSAVMVETLDLVRVQYEARLTADSFEIVRQKLVEQKEATNRQFFEQGNALSSVVESLAAAGQRVEDLPIGSQDFGAYGGGLKRVYGRGRRRMARAYEDGRSPQKFHDWRKRVKDLWHYMEFLQPLWPPILDAAAVELHRLSDYLGEAHDAAVLTAYIEKNRSNFAGEPDLPLLLTLLSDRRRELESAAQPLGRLIYGEKPAEFVRRLAAYWDTWQQI